MSINPVVYPLPSGVNKNNLALYHTYQTPTGGRSMRSIRTSCVRANPTLPYDQEPDGQQDIDRGDLPDRPQRQGRDVLERVGDPVWLRLRLERQGGAFRAQSLARSEVALRLQERECLTEQFVGIVQAPGGSKDLRSVRERLRQVGWRVRPLAGYRSPRAASVKASSNLSSLELVRARTERQSG